MRYDLGSTTRRGNRPSNEDRYALVEKSAAVLLVMADGLGGHSGGALAAETLVETVAREFRNTPAPIADPQTFLARAIGAAHQAVCAAGQRQDPPLTARTTCVLCLIQDGRAWWAHVGDSRLYLFRFGSMIFRTRDHSLVEEALQEGKLSGRAARKHSGRNQLTRCIGGEPSPPRITIGNETPLCRGDIILMCSDGLWSGIDSETIGQLLLDQPLDDAVNAMSAIAEQRTQPRADNISVVALRWLSSGIARPDATRQEAPRKAPPKPAPAGDALAQAIADIDAAFEAYKSELD